MVKKQVVMVIVMLCGAFSNAFAAAERAHPGVYDYFPFIGRVAGCKNTPVNLTVAEIINDADVVTDLGDVYYDDRNWYEYQEKETGLDWDFYMFGYNVGGEIADEIDKAMLCWQVTLPDPPYPAITLYYWDFSETAWVAIYQNEGGQNPPTEFTDVMDAFTKNPTGSSTYFLFVVNTLEDDKQKINCGVATLHCAY